VYDIDPPRIYDFFDKDAAGVDNIFATKQKLTKLPIFVMRLPKHRDDPAEMQRQEVERAMQRALTMGEFVKVARTQLTDRKVKTYA
jgi:hypothetical protein